MTSTQSEPSLELDAIIVGAGFSGISTLYQLRDKLKLRVKLLEAGSDLGGTWNCNRYPGARVDIPAPVYSLDIEEVSSSWTWSELYPAQKEMQAYFNHVDKTLGIRKDCIFNSRVISARFDSHDASWTLQTECGKVGKAKYFIPATGFASKKYTPAWIGLESFKGAVHHSAAWPSEEIDVNGKRVAIIGTGATGVQIVQEWAKSAAETFVFQRTPNLALPMRQCQFDDIAQEKNRQETAQLMARCRTTEDGHAHSHPLNRFNDLPRAENEKELNRIYDEGGLRYWTGAYIDQMLNSEANRLAYDVWAKRTHERIHDPTKRDLLAPLTPPYAFGTKRPSLEQDYFEQFNRASVHIVDVKLHPIIEITPLGIRTDNSLYEVDVIAIATGFDASTGGLAQMGIQGLNGVEIEGCWRDGVSTLLGLMVPGFPNMFLPYFVQSPSPFANAPVLIEFQASFIHDVVKRMEHLKIRYIDPQPLAAMAWASEVQTIGQCTLVPQTASWYTGGNIPGKKQEMLYYMGGISRYRQKCAEAIGFRFKESFICHY